MDITATTIKTPIALAPLERDVQVSVLVANYNYGNFVGAAIESVIAQTHATFELIVSDDGSTDDSCAVIQSYVERDPRVSLVRLSQNQGMAAATNAAFAASSGTVICLLDADDTYLPTKLERVVQQFRRDDRAGLLVHPLTIVDVDGRPVQQIPYLTQFERGWIADSLRRRGGRWRDMGTTALCFRRNVAELAFPIPEEAFRRAADGYLFTLMPLLTEVTAVDEPLARYHVHGANDHVAFGLNIRGIQSVKRFLELQIDHVNRRMRTLDATAATLDLQRHLVYRQQLLLLHLLDRGTWLEVFSESRVVVRMLIADALYRLPQKMVGIVVLGVGLLIPPRWRLGWLDLTLGFNRSKQRVKEALSRTGQVARRWLRPRAS